MLQNKQSYGLIIKQSSSFSVDIEQEDWREPGVQSQRRATGQACEPSLFPWLLSDQATHSLFLPLQSAPPMLECHLKNTKPFIFYGKCHLCLWSKKSRTCLWKNKCHSGLQVRLQWGHCLPSGMQGGRNHVSFQARSLHLSATLVCLPAFKMPGHHFTLSSNHPK